MVAGMKQNPRIVLPAVALFIMAVVAVTILLRPQHPASVPPTKPAARAPASENHVVLLPSRTQPKAIVEGVSNQLAAAENSVIVKTQAFAAVKKPAGSGKKVIRDPLAREALALVGTYPEAEAYWFAALGNPNLPQNERQDLVDDLNEEGLPDPKHPTADDLPVLLARIEMLEEAMLWFEGDTYDWKEPHDDLARLIRVASGSDEKID
jgi:hypothetical protein